MEIPKSNLEKLSVSSFIHNLTAFFSNFSKSLSFSSFFSALFFPVFLHFPSSVLFPLNANTALLMAKAAPLSITPRLLQQKPLCRHSTFPWPRERMKVGRGVEKKRGAKLRDRETERLSKKRRSTGEKRRR